MYGYIKRDMLQWVYKIEAEWTETASGKPTHKSGSGFIANSGGQPFLVTNRHIVDPCYVERRDSKLSGLTIKGFSKGFEPLTVAACGSPILPFYSSSFEEDVAVVRLQDLTVTSFPNSKLCWIQRDFWLDDNDFGRLVELGDLLAIPGYPRYFDQAKFKAIARFGNVASDPSDNYVGPGQSDARRIAYEAMSTSGNSGAPVLALARGFLNQTHPDLPPPRAAKLIGVNAGHFKDEHSKSHDGISYCFRIQIVIDIMEANGFHPE
jgi:Trypsin-like peptidase domain